MSKTREKIIILDFGGQYTHLIARRVRQFGIYSEIVESEEFNPDVSKDVVGIIFSGGPRSVTDDDSYKITFDIKKVQVPMLGICYGHQLLAQSFGGSVEKSKNKEYGLTTINVVTEAVLFKNTPAKQITWMSHGDHVNSLPDGFNSIASSDELNFAAYEEPSKKIFGVQFHPEVTHTQYGMQILDNFLNICSKNRNWKTWNFKDEIIQNIKEKTEDKKLIIFVSGGVDSLVALELCYRAVGKERIYAVHIDTGFMRVNESADVSYFVENLKRANFILDNSEDAFINSLKDISDPEEKRKIIGRQFVECSSKWLNNKDALKENFLLVQGTIYPDTIESAATSKSTLIKTHHNRVPEITKLINEGKVLEPLKELYKDEVRQLGKELDLPEKFLLRHPFPGPGLAIRIICSNTDIPEKNYDSEKELLNSILAEYELEGEILPVKSVGVQGDGRTYLHPALIWFKEECEKSYDKIVNATSKVISQLKTVNRVVFSLDNVSNRLKLAQVMLTKRSVKKLQYIDNLINKHLLGINEIWQLPVVSLPLIDDNKQQAFVMRPVCSVDAMTADFYRIDFNQFREINKLAVRYKEVGYLFLDVTSKPPATIEWE